MRWNCWYCCRHCCWCCCPQAWGAPTCCGSCPVPPQLSCAAKLPLMAQTAISLPHAPCPLPAWRQVYNNLIHDIDGAGFGVWGCYDCTFAYNTLVRVGRRSHVIEVKFGEHSCDGA